MKIVVRKLFLIIRCWLTTTGIFVKLKIDTGRTHQIRVHMSGIGHPVIGDKLYGSRRLDEKESPDRHILHAWKTRIIHPGTQEIMTFTAPLHEDYKSVCRSFGIEFNV